MAFDKQFQLVFLKPSQEEVEEGQEGYYDIELQWYLVFEISTKLNHDESICPTGGIGEWDLRLRVTWTKSWYRREGNFDFTHFVITQNSFQIDQNTTIVKRHALFLNSSHYSPVLLWRFFFQFFIPVKKYFQWLLSTIFFSWKNCFVLFENNFSRFFCQLVWKYFLKNQRHFTNFSFEPIFRNVNMHIINFWN